MFAEMSMNRFRPQLYPLKNPVRDAHFKRIQIFYICAPHDRERPTADQFTSRFDHISKTALRCAAACPPRPSGPLRNKTTEVER